MGPTFRSRHLDADGKRGIIQFVLPVGKGAFGLRSRSTVRTSKHIQKIASATNTRNAANTNHGQR